MFLQSDQSAFLAARHGVVSRSEALAQEGLGLSRGQLDRLLAAGVLLLVQPGAYRLAAAPNSWEARLRAAVVSCSVIASHRAAASLWHIDGFARAPLEVSVGQGSRPSREGVKIRRSTQMHLADAVDLNGIPTTSAARTLLDLFAILGWKRRQQALDAFLRHDLGDFVDLYDVIVRHSIQGRNGVRILRRELDQMVGPQVIPDSRFNRMVGQLLADHGIVGFVYEHEVQDAAGYPCWPG